MEPDAAGHPTAMPDRVSPGQSIQRTGVMAAMAVCGVASRALRFVPILALGCIAMSSASPSASLAATRLCDGYSECSTGGYTTHGYPSHESTSYWSMDPGGECTNYAAYVESAVFGAPTPSFLLGNADEWAETAGAHGIEVNNTPTVGSVAEWNAGDYGMGSEGHVAIVEAVGPDNSYVDISQQNIITDTNGYDWERIHATQPSNRWEPWPDNFIHFVSAPTQTPPPTITDFEAKPSTLGAAGGSVGLSAQVTNGSTCVVSSSPTFAGMPSTVPCTADAFSTTVAVPANKSTKKIKYKLTLAAEYSSGSKVKTVKSKPVTVMVAATETVATQISLNDDDDACALLASGAVDCWGIDSFGILGESVEGNGRTPTPIAGISGAKSIATGGGFACALLYAGGVECWGSSFDGELGDGSIVDSSTPVAVSGISNATAIAAGESDACAVLSTGGVDCWGGAEAGQLGDEDATGPDSCNNGPCSTMPVPVIGISDATAVTVGQGDGCALLATGGVDCWGGNSGYGELGDGSVIGPEVCQNLYCATTPVQVAGISDATAVSAGVWYACAKLSGGSMDCWGDDGTGQLGNGTANPGEPYPTPVPVKVVKAASDISAGQSTTCAALTSGRMDCWGAGGLGNRTKTESDTPISVTGITDATSVSAGNAFACGLLASGGVDCWGDNDNGQLGNGTNQESDVPVHVAFS
jgi:alpha-tubulin suppressor-like RCC1 family protein/surface antigen